MISLVEGIFSMLLVQLHKRTSVGEVSNLYLFVTHFHSKKECSEIPYQLLIAKRFLEKFKSLKVFIFSHSSYSVQ